MNDNILANKTVQAVLGILGLFLAILIIGRVVDIYQKVSSVDKDRDTLTISATAEIDAKADIAEAYLGVVTEGNDPSTIQDENNEKINKIIDFLKSQSVSEDDIKTQNYNLYPRYDYNEGRQTFDGYTINQQLFIKFRDLDKVGEIVSGAITRGATSVNSVTFSIDDPEELRQQARQQALANAKSKAQELAEVAGVKLGKVRSFSENSVSYPSPYPFYDRAIGFGGAEQSVSADFQPGTTTVTASVSVTFELK